MKQGLGTKDQPLCAPSAKAAPSSYATRLNNKDLIASPISRKTLSVFLRRLGRSSDTRIMYFEADVVFIYLNAGDVSISTYC